jgi:FHS family L-fucose permease-like MFS transporter
MILFWPAARSGQYGAFLVALFMVGGGASILETAANPFVAQFGPAETSERRLNFAQAFNPPGTILGVLVGARFIFSGIELNPSQVTAMQAAGTYQAYLHTELMRVVPPYIVLGSVVLIFAAILSRMEFPVIRSEHEGTADDHGSIRELLHYPHLWLAVFALFCTVGAQISSWSGVIVYAKQFTPASERVAAGYLTATLVIFALGRICSTPIMKYVAPGRLLCLYAVTNVGLLLIAITHPGTAGLYSIVLSSFFMSIMFPTVFAMGVKGLGANTKLAGAFLVMTLIGGAIFPAVFGWIANRTGSLALAYVAPLLGYTVLAMYAWREQRTRVADEA